MAEKKTSCGYENEKNRKKNVGQINFFWLSLLFYWPFFVFVSRRRRARVESKFSARRLKIKFHVFFQRQHVVVNCKQRAKLTSDLRISKL